MYNVTEKKSSPYIEILSEAFDKQLGASDMQNSLVQLLAKEFDSMKERSSKPSVLTNTRAVSRLKKEVVKIMEVLSANKAASIKVPELLDYVTLQFMLNRETFEAANQEFAARIIKPVNEALERAGLSLEDIDDVELLGGGIRVPIVMETLQN